MTFKYKLLVNIFYYLVNKSDLLLIWIYLKTVFTSVDLQLGLDYVRDEDYNYRTFIILELFLMNLLTYLPTSNLDLESKETKTTSVNLYQG